MYGMNYLEQTSIPPRTSTPRTVVVGANRSYGNLQLSLRNSAWTELKSGQVKEIIAAMQQWLSELKLWNCPNCRQVNEGLQVAQYEYNWIKCGHCKKNIPLPKIEWIDS